MPTDDWTVFEDAPQQRVLRRRLRVAAPLVVVLGTASAFFSKGGQTPFELLGWVAVPLWFAGSLVVVLVVWLCTRGTIAPFAVDLERQVIRIRGRVHPFSDIDMAELDPLTNNEKDALSIRFGVRRGRKASVLIREGRRPALDGDRRDLLLAVIAGSSIVRPSSPHDPTGRFARFNFPGTLDREAAARVVEAPPQVDEPAP